MKRLTSPTDKPGPNKNEESQVHFLQMGLALGTLAEALATLALLSFGKIEP